MRIYILGCLFAATIFSCTKVEHQENLYIRGRLFLVDTITLNVIDSPLANKRVMLASNNGDSLNYLYADTTDANGYFLFDLLNDDKTSFVVKYEEKVNTYLYTAEDTVSKGENNIAVVASLDQKKQNGLHIVVMDINGTRISNTTAWVFNNPTFFASGSSTGKNFDLITNSYGISSKLNIVPGPFYGIRIKTRIGNIDFEGTGTSAIGNAGIETIPITLVQTKMGFELLIQDNQSPPGPINNAQVYVYKSQTVFQLDVTNTNASHNLSSDASGKCELYNIESGIYYLRVIKDIGNDVLKAETSVVVNENFVTYPPPIVLN